jgi:hypothetical protein
MNNLKFMAVLWPIKIPLIFSALLAIVLLPSAPSQARQQPCNRNAGSERGVDTIRSNSAIVHGYVVKIELRYDRNSGLKWARGCVPAGTKLYLKDRNGEHYGVYIAGVNGWNFADKVTYDRPIMACAKHSDDPRELCTPPG